MLRPWPDATYISAILKAICLFILQDILSAAAIPRFPAGIPVGHRVFSWMKRKSYPWIPFATKLKYSACFGFQDQTGYLYISKDLYLNSLPKFIAWGERNDQRTNRAAEPVGRRVLSEGFPDAPFIFSLVPDGDLFKIFTGLFEFYLFIPLIRKYVCMLAFSMDVASQHILEWEVQILLINQPSTTQPCLLKDLKVTYLAFGFPNGLIKHFFLIVGRSSPRPNCLVGQDLLVPVVLCSNEKNMDFWIILICKRLLK